MTTRVTWTGLFAHYQVECQNRLKDSTDDTLAITERRRSRRLRARRSSRRGRRAWMWMVALRVGM